MPHVKAAAAAAISQGRAMDGPACSYGVSNDKASICGLWDACPIVVVAQRPVDWRLASSTCCGCAAAAD